MSEQRKAKRAAYEKRQEAQGKKVVNWIFGILVAAAVIFGIALRFMMG